MSSLTNLKLFSQLTRIKENRNIQEKVKTWQCYRRYLETFSDETILFLFLFCFGSSPECFIIVEWSSSFQLFISSHFPFTLQLYLNCGRIQVCSHWDSLVVLMLIMIDITEQMCFHICESISSLINW